MKRRVLLFILIVVSFASGYLFCFMYPLHKGKNNPVYLIIDIGIKNKELYSKYIEKVPEIIKKYDGRYLTRGGKIIPFAGNWNPERIVLIEFPELDQAQKCFSSPEYRAIAPFREQSTITSAIIVEGCASSER